MREFYNPGCGRCILIAESPGGAFLAAIIERDEFVVAYGLSKDGSWCHGTYYKDLSAAVRDFSKRG